MHCRRRRERSWTRLRTYPFPPIDSRTLLNFTRQMHSKMLYEDKRKFDALSPRDDSVVPYRRTLLNSRHCSKICNVYKRTLCAYSIWH